MGIESVDSGVGVAILCNGGSYVPVVLGAGRSGYPRISGIVLSMDRYNDMGVHIHHFSANQMTTRNILDDLVARIRVLTMEYAYDTDKDPKEYNAQMDAFVEAAEALIKVCGDSRQ